LAVGTGDSPVTTSVIEVKGQQEQCVISKRELGSRLSVRNLLNDEQSHAGKMLRRGFTPPSKGWSAATVSGKKGCWLVKDIKQKKPPFTESLSLARRSVADLVSLSENTTQHYKDKKGF